MQGGVINLILSMTVILPGLLYTLLADKIEYTPLSGITIAYAHVSRRTWVKVNRLIGVIMVVGGFCSMAVGLEYGVGVQASLLTTYIIVMIIVVIEYSRRLAELDSITTPPGGPLKPVPDPGSLGKLIATTTSMISVSLSIASSYMLYMIHAIDIGVTIVSLSMLALYLSILAVWRPESYALPCLDDSSIKITTISIPVTISMITISVSLAVLGLRSWWIPLIISIISGTLLIASLVKHYKCAEDLVVD